MANRFLSNIRINDAYTFPASDGTTGQVITTDGSGNLSFSDISVTQADSNFIYYNVKNSSGAAINKGTAVMASGTDGNSGHILIAPMVADGSVEPKYFIGILENTLQNGEIGRAIHFGELSQYNTSTYDDGDILWLDPATPGGYTTTEPLGPNLKIAAAIVINSATNGKIKVRVQGNAGLHELHDVKLVSEVNGDLLQWNSTTGVWENKSLASIADGRYVNVSGDTMTGNLNFTSTDRGLVWTMNTDGAYIKFFNTGDGDTDSRLEYGTSDNGNEYHRFMISGTERMKITETGIEATGYNKSNWDTAYGWGNHAGLYLPIGGKAADSELLDGVDSSRVVFGTNETKSIGFDNGNINNAIASGFYDGANITGAPSADYHHVINSRHSNPGNNYAMQIAGNFFSESLNYRQITNNVATPWRAIIHSGNIGSQSVSYATSSGNADTLDGIDSSNFFRTDGTYPNTDMNDTVEGYWHVASGSANLPINYYGHRWDYDHASPGQWVFQMYSPTSGDVDLWFRQKRDFTATAWQKVITSGNIGSQSIKFSTTAGDNRFGNILVGEGTYKNTIVPIDDTNLNINTPSGAVYFGSYTIATGSHRAPIFYDSDNTVYYANPESTSNFLRLDLQAYSFFNAGLQVRRNIGTTPPSWPDAEHTLSLENTDAGWLSINFHRSGYTSNNIYYTGTEIIVDDTYRSTVDMRAPIFYDSNDTGRYLDPSGFSNTGFLRVVGDWNSSGVHHEQLTIRGSYPTLGLRSTLHDMNFIVHNDQNLSVYSASGVDSASWGLRFRVDQSGNSFSYSSSRAPIFYDNDNTAYYVDPNSASRIENLDLVGDANLELRKQYSVDLRGLDSNTFYPVTFGVPLNGVWLEVQVNLNTGVAGDWSTHPGGFTLNLMWRTNGSGWGVTQVRREIIQNYQSWANKTICGGIGQLTQSSREYVYLRGGGLYYFYSSRPISPVIETATVTYNGQSIGPISGDSPANNVWESFTGSYQHYSDYLYTIALYDRNDTSYYLDPNSTSRLYRVDSPTGYTSVGNPWGTGDSAFFPNGISTAGGQNWIYGNTFLGNAPSNGAGHQFFTSGSSESTGDMVAGSSMRAPIFYNYTDTNYYIDADSTSNLLGLTVANQISGSISGASNALASTSYGNGNFTWRQDSAAFNVFNGWHNYLISNHGDGSSYFNTIIAMPFWGSPRYSRLEGGTQRGPYEFWTSERNIDSDYDVRATIFYDSVNTARYVDPSGLTSINALECAWSADFNAGVNFNDVAKFTTSVGINMLPNSSSSGGILSVKGGTNGKRAFDFFGDSYSSVGYIEYPFLSSGVTINNKGQAGSSGMSFQKDGTTVGNIVINTSSTSYNTSSDYRLKENVVPMTGSLDRLMLLKPSRFNFIGDDKTVDGFIAHEAQEVVPEAVTGDKDGIGWDGNPEYQGIDQSKLVPLLTAALQEAIAKIESLESRIQTLEAQ